MNWKPIETAPLLTEVLLWITTWADLNQPVSIGLVERNHDGTVWDMNRDMRGTASHWMRLPEPPVLA